MILSNTPTEESLAAITTWSTVMFARGSVPADSAVLAHALCRGRGRWQGVHRANGWQPHLWGVYKEQEKSYCSWSWGHMCSWLKYIQRKFVACSQSLQIQWLKYYLHFSTINSTTNNIKKNPGPINLFCMFLKIWLFQLLKPFFNICEKPDK